MGVFEDKKTSGQVFNIQKYSVHDGPGIRTIIFLKGCLLSCHWCSNPESQRREPELAHNVGRCLKVNQCRRCLDACPNSAIEAQEDGNIRLQRDRCGDCAMLCAEACPAQGLIVYGQERTVDDVLNVVEQDAAFYTRSKGGVTLSGGEPLLQGEFALAILREARRRRIRTAVETCGMVPWKIFEEAAPLLNYILFDIKHMDSAKHEQFTGRPNGGILDNLTKLVALDPAKEILCRTPIIPGFNDTEEEVRAICEHIKPFKNVRYEMLPYHRLGTQKYIFLDRVPPMGDIQLPSDVMPRLTKVAMEILGEERIELVK